MTMLERFEHERLTFDVRDEGPPDGDPVVLLHGFPERATSWRRVAPLLHEHGLRTYAPDQRGRLTRGNVTVPTTFVWSDGDVAVGPRGGRWTPRFVDAPYDYVELAGVSHWIPTEAPEALAEAIVARIGSVRA